MFTFLEHYFVCRKRQKVGTVNKTVNSVDKKYAIVNYYLILFFFVIFIGVQNKIIII